MDGSHDIHHKKGGFNYNFGTLGLFDRIYGTYKDPSSVPHKNKENEIIDIDEKLD